MRDELKALKVPTVVGAVGACAICCLPIVVPIVFGAVGGGAILMGQWVIGGLIALGAVWVVSRSRSKACAASCDCGPK